MRVFPVTDSGGTFILWKSDYEMRDDNAMHEFCDPIYQALLEDLGRHFG